MNMFFNKILLVCLSIFMLLGVTSTVSAQAGAYNNTSLYITKVKLDQTSYSPGENVTGSFVVHNINSFAVNDANYVISLASNYRDGGIPTNIIDTSDRIELPYLQSGSKETINFSYTLPSAADGSNFGINIRAVLDSGVKLGWGDARFDLTGDRVSSVITRAASIVVNGKAYITTTGPTIYSDDGGGILKANFKSYDDVDLVPHVVIKSQFNDEVVFDRELDVISVSSTGSDYQFQLPDTFSPGVYLGTMELLDSNKVNRISNLEFRYIIGGQIGTIQGVYSNQQEVEEGGVIVVDVNVTGTPADIVRVEELPTEYSAKLDVVIKDTKSGDIIGSESMDIVELIGETYTFNISVNKSSDNITIEAILYGADGSILDEYLTDIPESELMNIGKILINILIIVGVIVLLLLIGVMVKRKKAIETVETINQV